MKLLFEINKSIHLDKHLDRAWGTLWIELLNHYYLALQIKAFDQKNSNYMKKVPFCPFFIKGRNGHALLVPDLVGIEKFFLFYVPMNL